MRWPTGNERGEIEDRKHIEGEVMERHEELRGGEKRGIQDEMGENLNDCRENEMGDKN